MPYNPSTDLVGLWRAVSGGVEKAEMPGLDFVIQAMARAGLMRIVTSQTAPTTNQSTTGWFQPANPSFGSEGSLFLWDPTLNMYVPATPELFHGGDSSGGGGGGGGGSDMAIVSVSAPSNPASGQQWWDGTTMRVWDGSAWQIVGVTGAAPTTTITFSIAQGATPSFTNSTWVVAPWSASPSILASGDAWDAVNRKYTPSKAGYYLSSFWSAYSLSGAGNSGRAIQQNDNAADLTHTFSIASAYSPSAQPGWLSGTDIIKMNGTTDYVRMWISDTFGNASTSQIVWHMTLLP